MVKTTKQAQNNSLPSQQWQAEALSQQQELQERQAETLRRLAFMRQKETLRRPKQLETIYNPEQRQVREELKVIRQKIKDIAVKVVHINQEIDRAIKQPVVKANRYEVSFWRAVLIHIQDAVRNVENVDIWLQEWNKRKQRKGGFWGIVNNKKKGGAQFLLSSEHSASRSAS